MKSNSALIVFVRNPELGKVKTRLAKGIGDEKALTVYRFLLEHTLQICKEANCEKQIFYADKLIEHDIWTLNNFDKYTQAGEDLGHRMYNAFKECFDRGYTKVVIIGSDCYELTSSIINEAYRKLDIHNVVIGPTFDGGYYLLGLTQLLPEIFENKNWSTDQVMRQTTEVLMDRSIEFAILDQLHDVDDAEDLKSTGLDSLFLFSSDESGYE